MAESQKRAPSTMFVRMLLQAKKGGSSGQCIRATLPYIQTEIPIFIVFRALGFVADRDVLEHIWYDFSDTQMMDLLQPSLKEAFVIQNQLVALDYIGKRGSTVGITKEKRIGLVFYAYILKAFVIDPMHISRGKFLVRYSYIVFILSSFMESLLLLCATLTLALMVGMQKKILQKEMLPHVGVGKYCGTKKAYYFGYVIHRLPLCALGRRAEDDRDHYRSKRLDLTGRLLGGCFRGLFLKMTKHVRSYVQKCVDNGKEVDLQVAINAKIITSGLNYSIATGNWGQANAASRRAGVSQVLNRLTFISTLSHFQRLNSPICQGQLTNPRQLHNSHWGMVCPAETPEGQTCGLVRNLALMAHITLGSAANSSGRVEY
ncbi:hypothetical protein AMTR_s00068p00180360 [Amborella trichopoda]|uniref:DNA-directed RNA polymerase n=1 Tax=Amborella trichopoda TaxID=13333 RepID=U5DGA1_AMBTC|nr:hypothetical protein AMTR_s00068p00180360 [Amborella trichopoda]